MTRVRSLRRLLSVASLCVAAVALAACGSDSSSNDSGGSGSDSSSTTAPKRAAVILAKENPDLGMILVDAQGRTVYTLTNNGEAVECTGACLTAWPPVLLPDGETTATGGPGVKGLGVVDESSGTQVTVDGLPLYTFQGDTAPGMAKGEGLSSFGGVWNVVKVSGAAASSTTATTAKSSSGGMYDY